MGFGSVGGEKIPTESSWGHRHLPLNLFVASSSSVSAKVFFPNIHSSGRGRKCWGLANVCLSPGCLKEGIEGDGDIVCGVAYTHWKQGLQFRLLCAHFTGRNSHICLHNLPRKKFQVDFPRNRGCNFGPIVIFKLSTDTKGTKATQQNNFE